MLRSLLFSAFALTLCAQAPAPQPKPAAEAAPKEDKILARVGNEVIRQSELDAYGDSMDPQQRMMMGPQLQKAYLEMRILVAAARRDGMHKTPAFHKKMQMAELQLLASELLGRDGKDLQKKLELKDEELKAYYEAHKDRFKSGDSFDARHILVKLKGAQGGGEGYTEEEAKARIAKIQEGLKAGKGWDVLAKEFSDDPGSKDKGGLYEGIAYGRFVPEFEAAVKAQEPGKVGEPVKTAYGYHLIQVEKKVKGEQQSFEQAKEQVRQQAGGERKEKVWNDYLAGLRKAVGVVEGEAAAKAAPAPKAKPSRKPAGSK